jgi:hypothetical protein
MQISHKHIHVVAFDIPFPANYGGVIDIYYKIKALDSIGYIVHLHCFQYGRVQSKELNKICENVNYYKRKTYKNPFYGSLPYIVSTRNSPALLDNLKKDSYPILFEGLHTTYFLDHQDLSDRFKVVRMHNIEHDYYQNLEKVESNYFKKYFFRIESEKLKKFQSILKHANLVCGISTNDEKYLRRKFENVVHLPPFHGNTKVNSKEGRGKYVLYHGNLSVAENNEAALYLVNNVFSKVAIKCIIAGNNPSKELQHAALSFENIEIIDKTNSEHISELISNAHINVLHTFQATGIKLKLLNALFLGRYCIGNKEMIKNTGLEELCIQANSADEYVQKINSIWSEKFEYNLKRNEILLKLFSDPTNAKLFDSFIPKIMAGGLEKNIQHPEIKQSKVVLKSLLGLFSL